MGFVVAMTIMLIKCN